VLIKVKNPADVTENDVTDAQLFAQRRSFIRASGQIALGTALGTLFTPSIVDARGQPLKAKKNTRFNTSETLSSYQDVTSYNNFYEFGTAKEDPAINARHFKAQPWTVKVDGAVNKPGNYAFEDIINLNQLEERIYRFRCVEAWSMVVPWVGVSLASFINQFQPSSKAKYVEFTTLYDPKRMPGQNRAVLNWPYVEGLRMDEAMHPLSMMVVGLYGEVLPNQNGAPLRLMVPWKYGFKNIKSIVRIRFSEHQPKNTWQIAGPKEYGFYANVNPQVDHPRWSQKRERRLGEFLKRETLMFNGYADEVASLYQGMDLRKNF